MEQPLADQASSSEQAPHPSFLQHAMSPQNLGTLPIPAVIGQGRGTCGDSIELYLRIQENRVVATRFMPQGCMHTIACGSALTELVQGQPLEAVTQLGPAQIEEELGGLPREHRHCAVVAAMALKSALRKYFEDSRSPWKRMYAR